MDGGVPDGHQEEFCGGRDFGVHKHRACAKTDKDLSNNLCKKKSKHSKNQPASVPAFSSVEYSCNGCTFRCLVDVFSLYYTLL